MLARIQSEIDKKEEWIELLKNDETSDRYMEFRVLNELVDEAVTRSQDDQTRQKLLELGFYELVNGIGQERETDDDKKELMEIFQKKEKIFKTALTLHGRQGLQYIFIISLGDRGKTMLYHSYYGLTGFTKKAYEEIIEEYCMNKQEKIAQYHVRLDALYKKREELEYKRSLMTLIK
ncbi:MAG: hypothetical protein ACOYVK_08170 [Bacillota bacterium]